MGISQNDLRYLGVEEVILNKQSPSEQHDQRYSISTDKSKSSNRKSKKSLGRSELLTVYAAYMETGENERNRR
jgi:hypothetical protein